MASSFLAVGQWTEFAHAPFADHVAGDFCSAFDVRCGADVISSAISLPAPVNDIATATEIARNMVCEWGMSELGPLAYGKKDEAIFLGREINQHRDYSEDTAIQIDKEVKRIVSEGYEKAKSTLSNNKETLERIAQALLEREVIDATEVKLLMEGKPLPEKVRTPPTPPAQGAPSTDPKVVRPELRPAPGSRAAKIRPKPKLLGIFLDGRKRRSRPFFWPPDEVAETFFLSRRRPSVRRSGQAGALAALDQAERNLGSVQAPHKGYYSARATTHARNPKTIPQTRLKFPRNRGTRPHAPPRLPRSRKIFASLGYPDKSWGMVKLTPAQQAELMSDEPKVFFPAAGAWGRKGSTTVQLKWANKATVHRALEAAWRNTAPKDTAGAF